mmetsp:Transcript_41559/g.29939  ORF Transcript_41559/g.29939 Transcript_41559/m.29939 type:complete len:153 (+) Transcript_41559:1886-2344(+)
MSETNLQYILNDELVDTMANEGLRTIAFAYRDFEEQEFERMLNQSHLSEQLEQNMTFSCLVGLLDPLRPRVQKVIKYAQKGALEVRLISGDHVATAKAVAQDAGILDVDLVRQFTSEDEKKYVMHAKDFKEIVGDIIEEEDEDSNKTFRLEN